MNTEAAKSAPTETVTASVAEPADDCQAAPPPPPPSDGSEGKSEEVGGPSGPEPTRFGDWERKGRCIDF